METTIQQANRNKKATLDNFKVKRDGEGKLIPIECETEYGKVKVFPMTYGDAEKWAEEFKDTESVTSDRLAKQFRKHIFEPDMSKITGEELNQDFKPLAIKELIEAIAKVSGLEKEMSATVGSDGTVKVEMSKN